MGSFHPSDPGSGGEKLKLDDFRIFYSCKRQDVATKSAVRKASLSVVCLISRLGDELVFMCSGTIVECQGDGTGFVGTVLTSATLLGSSGQVDQLKVEVCGLDGTSFTGTVFGYDFHYNIALVTFYSSHPLPVATVRYLNHSMAPSMHSHDGNTSIFSRSLQFHHQQDKVVNSGPFKLQPRAALIALGCHFKKPYDTLAAAGAFSVDFCAFDCKELLRATCRITKIGIGGPMINQHGEVIGINFYDELYTPFLPINLVLKCMESLKKYRTVPKPWIGVKGTNLYEAGLETLEKIYQISPETSKGLLVKEVEPNSPASAAGICNGDVIAQCDGDLVGSSLELIESLWDKRAKPVEMVVIIGNTCKRSNVTIKSVETCPRENRWPVPVETPSRTSADDLKNMQSAASEEYHKIFVELFS